MLQGEYKKKAQDTDKEIVGGEEEVGPVEMRLQEFGPIHGLVVGAFAEGSEDLHGLIQAMAESRVASQDLMSRQAVLKSGGDLGVVVGQLRRWLSVAAVRANYTCLLSRLSLMGPEAKQAANRRQWQKREERLMRREKEAQWNRKTRGHGIMRRGEFIIN